MSGLESLAIGKAGVACVFGSNYNDILWSNLIADFLLFRFLEASDTSRVVAVLLDRSSRDLPEVVLATTKKHSKLSFIECDDISMDSYEAVLQKLSTKLSELVVGKTAVFVYSFSELVLNIGSRKAMDYIRRIDGIVGKAGNVVMTVHDSLHTPIDLTRFQAFANVAVIVKPNKGLLSHEVIAEVHSIRRSLDSGRVTEELDMFTYNQSLIKGGTGVFPIAPILKEEKSSSANKAPVEAKSDTVTSVLDGVNQSSDKTASKEEPKANNTNLLKNLITFDSTDPEFDEDEDPDDDLDL